MVVDLRVPAKYRAALLGLRDISDDSEQRLVEGLTQIDHLPTKAELNELVRRTLELDADDSDRLVDTLFQLHAIRIHQHLSEADVARLLSEAPELDISAEHRADFAGRLDRLLRAAPFGTVAKALDLLAAQDHMLTEVRVITDVRPVFEDDPEQPPSGALLIHTLKLDYFSGAESYSFYVTMDDEDLEALIQQAQRAQKKANGMRSLLSSAGLRSFQAVVLAQSKDDS